MKGYKFLLILSLVIVFSLAVVIWFYPPSEDFGKDNHSWNGLKKFYSEFEASSIDSLDDLPVNPGETVLVSIPYLQYKQQELLKLKDYLSQGGTIIVLDDYGYGNDIVDYLNIDFRFTPSLLDPLSNDQNEFYPRITSFASVSATENVGSILLNHAAGLSGGSEEEVIAWSSRFSFFDLNNNSNWDEGEPKGPIAVAAVQPVGDGNLVLIADPSILINSMVERDNNHKFIENITQIQSPNPKILVDQAHLPETSIYGAKEWLATARDWFSSTPAVSGLVVVALIVTLRPLRKKQSVNSII